MCMSMLICMCVDLSLHLYGKERLSKLVTISEALLYMSLLDFLMALCVPRHDHHVFNGAVLCLSDIDIDFSDN